MGGGDADADGGGVVGGDGDGLGDGGEGIGGGDDGNGGGGHGGDVGEVQRPSEHLSFLQAPTWS